MTANRTMAYKYFVNNYNYFTMKFCWKDDKFHIFIYNKIIEFRDFKFSIADILFYFYANYFNNRLMLLN